MNKQVRRGAHDVAAGLAFSHFLLVGDNHESLRVPFVFHHDPELPGGYIKLDPAFVFNCRRYRILKADFHFKVGASVILLRNLDPENGLCNLTRLIVQS